MTKKLSFVTNWRKNCHLPQIEEKAIVCQDSTKELSFVSNQLMMKVH
jgi:hypothetical protein